MVTYSQAREALKASPAPDPPSVTTHAAMRTPATAAMYAQNSVVLGAYRVSVAIRRAPRVRPPSPARVAPETCVAMSCSLVVAAPLAASGRARMPTGFGHETAI